VAGISYGFVAAAVLTAVGAMVHATTASDRCSQPGSNSMVCHAYSRREAGVLLVFSGALIAGSSGLFEGLRRARRRAVSAYNEHSDE
jgi:hypothetical protein